jgi:hypothetical protein
MTETEQSSIASFVETRFLSIVFVLVAGALVAVLVGVDTPSTVTVALLGALAGAPVGFVAFGRIREYLPTPPMVWIVDVDVLDDDGAGLWRIPESKWGDLDVSSGSLWNPAPSLYFGKGYDAEEMTIEGTWRGSLSDGEMLRALSLVKEVRGDLQDRARRGERIRNNAFTLIRGAVQGEVERIVGTFEEGTLPSGGEEFESQIEDALSDFDLDELATDGLDLDGDGDGLDGDHGDGPPDQDEPTPDAGGDDFDQEVSADD